MSPTKPPPASLTPLKIGPAAGARAGAAGAAAAAAAHSSPASSSVSPTNPTCSSASTPTPTPTSSNSPPIPTQPAKTPSASHHHHHQRHPPSSSTLPIPPATSTTRAPIQPTQPRRSLPVSSPAAAAPANNIFMASVISPMPGPPAAKAPISMTTKEWVIPPRPKPGRKPATDTPPTKRKAQNRAAQRAFRERRAARVGELEEQLDAEREEHEAAQAVLHDRIRRLEMDSQALQSRCEVLENMLDKERVERAKEVEALTTRLHEATTQSQNHHHHHPARQSLPSILSVSDPRGPYAPQPLRYHHRPSAPSRLSNLGRANTSGGPTARTTPAATAQSHRPSTTNSFSISQIISPTDDIEQTPTTCGSCDGGGHCACAEEAMANMPVGCGNCTLGSRCQCLEEVLNGAAPDSTYPDAETRADSVANPQPSASRTAKRTIRSISPSCSGPEEKRARPSLSHAATETDFTAMFSRQPRRVSPPNTTTTTIAPVQPAAAAIQSIGTPYSNAPSPYSLAPADPQAAESPAPEDRCGFCEDGTYCVCAEAAKNAALSLQPPATESVTLPPITSSVLFPVQQARTPPPSEGDANGYEILPDGAVKLPSLKALSSQSKNGDTDNTAKPSGGGCGPGGPGTCAQCIADPKSGLFCRSLAASFQSKNREPSGGCCGGGGAGGGCCKDKTQSTSGGSKSSPGVRLSCADAYKTLASHRNFNEAADDIGTWLPMLRAAPARPREPEIGGCRGAKGGGSSRTPIEVEAASIMSVLKGFDVRFGRGE